MSYVHTASDVLLVGIVITVNETDLTIFFLLLFNHRSLVATSSQQLLSGWGWFFLFFLFFSSTKAPLSTARVSCFCVGCSTNRKYCDMLHSKIHHVQPETNASCWPLALLVKLNGALKEIHVPVKAFSNLQILSNLKYSFVFIVTHEVQCQ